MTTHDGRCTKEGTTMSSEPFKWKPSPDLPLSPEKQRLLKALKAKEIRELKAGLRRLRGLS